MTMTIQIYEPIYDGNQTLQCPQFKPWIVGDSARSSWREFAILVDMYRQGVHLLSDFTGLLSPKFTLKTGIKGKDVFAIVAAHEDCDIILMNPFPQLSYISYNVWMEGEAAHPGLTERAQALLGEVGYDCNPALSLRHGPGILCYSNFWVGSKLFWERYVGGLLVPTAELLERDETGDLFSYLWEDTQHSEPTAFLPFIIERLLTTFLSAASDLRISAHLLDARALCLNRFELAIVDSMTAKVDAADLGLASWDVVRQEMRLLTTLRMIYTLDFYAVSPHPHIGKPLVLLSSGSHETNQ